MFGVVRAEGFLSVFNDSLWFGAGVLGEICVELSDSIEVEGERLDCVALAFG